MTTATRQKPKRTRAKRKQAKAKGKEKRARANYGANERPKHCRNVACGSERSHVKDTRHFFNPDRTIRYRLCDDCGQRYSTIEIEETTTA